MEANSTESIKKCPKCDAVLDDKAKFCLNCGRSTDPLSKKEKKTMFDKILILFYSFLVLLLIGLIESMSDTDESTASSNEKYHEKTEAEIKRDSVTTEIAKETGLDFQEIKSFERNIDGLTVVSISTGNLPINPFHSSPACNIKIVNTDTHTVSWDLFLKCRVVVDDIHISASSYCESTVSYNDPISQGQVVSINCTPGIGNFYIPNKQWGKSKIIIEILKEGKMILSIPIKNKFIDLKDFMR